MCASSGPTGAPFLVGISVPDEYTVVVTPTGEADVYSLVPLQEALLNAVREGRPRIIVDLDHLTFMDASTLGLLVGARRRISAEGGFLRVRCHAGLNRRLLTMTGLGGMLDPGLGIDDLSDGEHQILHLVARGLTNREIADELSVSIDTVKTHLRFAYRKIGVDRRSHAVAWVLANRD